MFALSAENSFHMYSHPTDMRESFDALSGLVRNNLGSDPTNGEVFIFINKRRDKVKLLHWQGSGYLLYYKRLEKGTFELPRYDAWKLTDPLLQIGREKTKLINLVE